MGQKVGFGMVLRLESVESGSKVVESSLKWVESGSKVGFRRRFGVVSMVRPCVLEGVWSGFGRGFGVVLGGVWSGFGRGLE
jgi:hypothetical protein